MNPESPSFGAAPTRLVEEHARHVQPVIDALTSQVALLDGSANIVAVNAAWKRFSDGNACCLRDNGLGANYLALLDGVPWGVGDDSPAAVTASQVAKGLRAVLGGAVDKFQCEYRCDSPAEQRCFLLTITPLHGDGAIRAVVAHENVTALKLAQQALQASELRFDQLLKGIPAVAVQGYAPDGTTLYWNPASEELYGYAAAEVIGRNLLDLIIPPELHSGMREAMRRAFEQGRPMPAGELSLMRKDGSRVEVYSSNALVRIPHQAPEMFCMDVDLTERKRVEAALRVAATAFETQEGMAITDARRVILRVNTAFSEITGYSAGEAVGQTPCFLNSGRQNAAFYADMWDRVERTGSWQGEIWNRRKNGEVYPEWLTVTAVKGDDGIVTHYVGAFADITLRKTAEDEINHLAFYDHLTHLPNRRLMLDRLGQALTSSERHGRYGALMLIDLDNFKLLNDTLGHAVGDQLLVEAARRLESSIRDGDTVARLGGDEFVVILEDLDEGQQSAVQAEGVAIKILAKLCAAYQLEVDLDDDGPSRHSHQCTSSIGITLFRGYAVSVDELLRRADTAMYQAKAAGRNALRFFDPETQAAVRARASLELELRKAIVEGQFLLHYQAQVDAAGSLIGAEALVRWQHPERGLLFPAEFIVLAENTGLILPLGHQILATVCAQLAVWATRPETAQLSLSVNVSARQLSVPNFVEQVLAVLEHAGARPDRLRLELTESLLLDNSAELVGKMRALKARGVGFALDDFGTGYSSLSSLKRLPLDQLKIDRSFVRDLLTDANNAAIARSIVALSQTLGLAVIAEGVETLDQRNFLADSGCLNYQGYFFSRPMPIEGFESFARCLVSDR